MEEELPGVVSTRENEELIIPASTTIEMPENASDLEIKYEDLPPMPERRLKEMWSQSSGGSCLVTCITTVLMLWTHLLTVQSMDLPETPATICLAMMWSCAVLAVVCLVGLLFSDPGECKRSPEVCFPIPEEVREKLLKGESTSHGLSNIIVDAETPELAKTYCVRCLLWRPKVKYHHCSVCQRCVGDFDHHCGVFGRCIAGKGIGPCGTGNMKYFVGMVIAGCGGELICIVWFMIAISLTM